MGHRKNNTTSIRNPAAKKSQVELCSDALEALLEFAESGNAAAEEVCQKVQQLLKECPQAAEVLESFRQTLKLCEEVSNEEEPGSLDPSQLQDLKQAYQQALHRLKNQPNSK